MHNNIGQNLTILRNNHGYTQEKLAELAGISTTHLSHIETGRCGMSLSLLLDLCHCLAVTPNDILFGEYGETLSNDNPRKYIENLPCLTDMCKELLYVIINFMVNRDI